MKKIIFISTLIIFILISVSVYIMYNNKEKSLDNDFYMEIYNRNNNVDDGINALMDSKEYKVLNEDEKIEMIGQFLELYQSSGVINSLFYDSDNKLYSFKYSGGELDGTLSGVSLQEFNQKFN